MACFAVPDKQAGCVMSVPALFSTNRHPPTSWSEGVAREMHKKYNWWLPFTWKNYEREGVGIFSRNLELYDVMWDDRAVRTSMREDWYAIAGSKSEVNAVNVHSYACSRERLHQSSLCM
jgi:hypothetical protein